MTMLGKTVNGYQIIACAYRSGDPDRGIVILAKDQDRESYVTAMMNHESDKEWYWGHYFNIWDAADKSFLDFTNRAQ